MGLRTPPTGGRPTDPEWTLRRLVPLSAATLGWLGRIGARTGVSPMQAAAILLEHALDRAEEESA